jgi:hypothetical protein
MDAFTCDSWLLLSISLQCRPLCLLLLGRLLVHLLAACHKARYAEMSKRFVTPKGHRQLLPFTSTAQHICIGAWASFELSTSLLSGSD